MKHGKTIETPADRVSFLGGRQRWVGFALYIFSGCVSVYAGFSIHEHVATDGWKGFKTVRAVVNDMGGCVPCAGAAPIVIFCIVEVCMIFYEIVKAHLEARRQERIKRHEARGRAEGEARGRAEGEARGRAEGEARGRAEGESIGEERGRVLERQEWLEWMAQRQQAEDAGEPFTEPNPAEKQNGTPPQ